MDNDTRSIPLFSGRTAAHSLRASGYNNSAYALAELIDNSVEAGATDIHICALTDGSIQQIAVLDNGKGMDPELLQWALQAGHGTRLNVSKKERKLGRFGVGLTNASFSQCEKLDAWSWQNGPANSYKAFLHLPNESEDDEEIQIRPAEKVDLPSWYDSIFRQFPNYDSMESGSLIVWDDIKRLDCKKPETLFTHLSEDVGRIFRQFISKGTLNIKLSVWDIHTGEEARCQEIKAVDPLFLSPIDYEYSGRKVEEEFTKKANFQPLNGHTAINEDGTVRAHKVFKPEENGVPIDGEIRIYVSHRTKEVVDLSGGKDPGKTNFGKLAEKLRGVSITRAGRELILDRSWMKDDATTDRWIGICVDFDPALDEIFGVHNNKQNAQYLSKLSTRTLDELKADEYEAANEIVKQVAISIKEIINDCKREIRLQRKGARDKTSGGENDLSLKQGLTLKIAERSAQGYIASYDRIDPAQHKDDIRQSLREKAGLPSLEIEKGLKLVLDKNLKVDIKTSAYMSSRSDIFSVTDAGGVLNVILNETHPMYTALLSAIEGDEQGLENITAEERLRKAEQLIKTLIVSYARAEAESLDKRRDDFETVRHLWGVVAKDLFNPDE